MTITLGPVEWAIIVAVIGGIVAVVRLQAVVSQHGERLRLFESMAQAMIETRTDVAVIRQQIASLPCAKGQPCPINNDT